jgi:hypothetical protein
LQEWEVLEAKHQCLSD